MTSGLRKIHKLSWILITVVGVVFLFFVMQTFNFSPKESTKSDELNLASYSQVVENNWIKIARKEKQVIVILKRSLKASSSVVYGLTNKNEKGNGLGQVSKAGVYAFEISEPVDGVLIYDEIKEVEITKLSF